MPALEFWTTGYAVIPAAGFFFALVLGALGVGPMLTKPLHKRIVWSGVAVIAALTWWQLAKREEENAKPGRDYVYFVLSSDPRDNDGRIIRLVSIATGPLKELAVAIQTAEERRNGSRVYIFGGRFPAINEGGTLLSLALPSGDYWIDLDQPEKLGQVLEHLEIRKDAAGNFIGSIRVTRKETGEVLIPARATISTSGAIVLVIICLSFMSFAVALGWASCIAPEITSVH